MVTVVVVPGGWFLACHRGFLFHGSAGFDCCISPLLPVSFEFDAFSFSLSLLSNQYLLLYIVSCRRSSGYAFICFSVSLCMYISPYRSLFISLHLCISLSLYLCFLYRRPCRPVPPPSPSRPPRCRLLFRYRDANVHVFTRDPWRSSFKYNVQMPWYARLVLAKNVIWHDVLEADQTSKVLIAVGEKNICVTACFVQHVRCA